MNIQRVGGPLWNDLIITRVDIIFCDPDHTLEIILPAHLLVLADALPADPSAPPYRRQGRLRGNPA